MRTNKDGQLLRHIVEYCNQVEEAVTRIETVENLLSDQFSRNALAMPLAQIGELVRILSDEFKRKYKDIPWAEIKGIKESFGSQLRTNRLGQSMEYRCNGYS